MSTGELLVARAAMKPLATLNRPVLKTVDVVTKEETVSFKERTDVTAVPAHGRGGRDDGGARARRRGQPQVRRRLGRRVLRATAHVVRSPRSPSGDGPRRAGRDDGRGQDHGRPDRRRPLGSRRSSTATSRSRRRPAAPSARSGSRRRAGLPRARGGGPAPTRWPRAEPSVIAAGRRRGARPREPGAAAGHRRPWSGSRPSPTMLASPGRASDDHRPLLDDDPAATARPARWPSSAGPSTRRSPTCVVDVDGDARRRGRPSAVLERRSP